MGVPVTLPFTFVNGTTADATQVDANFNAIVSALASSAAASGANSDITSLSALTTPLSPGQGGSSAFVGTAPSGGSANAQTVGTTIPGAFALTAGARVYFIAGFTNTGATTLNVNSTGATNIFRRTLAGPVALVGGEIIVNTVTVVSYDGTRFQLLSLIDENRLFWGGTAGGTGNAVTVATPTPADFTLTAGYRVQFLVANNNSGATTLNVAGLGATNFFRLSANGAVAMVGGELLAGNIVEAVYDGTQFELVGGFPPQNTRQVLTTGSGATFTPTNPGVRQLRVRMIGGGGGGGGSSVTTGAGGTGGTTTFAGINANGGAGGGAGSGINAGLGGVGGNGGTGSASLRVPGGTGSVGSGATTPTGTTVILAGGIGAHGGFGGAATAANNTGAGGAGTSVTVANTTASSGGGGGAGEYVELLINGPLGAITYTVGSAGTAGGSATAGGLGLIVVDEIY